MRAWPSGGACSRTEQGPLKSSLPRRKDISSLALTANAQRADRAQPSGMTLAHNQGTVGREALSILPIIAEAIYRPRSRGQGHFFLSLLKGRISHNTLLIMLAAAGPFAFASEALAA